MTYSHTETLKTGKELRVKMATDPKFGEETFPIQNGR